MLGNLCWSPLRLRRGQQLRVVCHGASLLRSTFGCNLANHNEIGDNLQLGQSMQLVPETPEKQQKSKESTMLKRYLIVVIILTVVSLAGCGGGEEPTPTPTPLATFTPTAAPTQAA